MLIGLIKEHIEITAGVCGGKTRIAWHRIKVQDIAICYERLNMSPAEIVSNYPSIGLADVHAALAYYYDHRVEINLQIEETNIGMNYTSNKHCSYKLNSKSIIFKAFNFLFL